MNTEHILRDLKVFALVTLFYLILFFGICLARRARRGSSASLKAEISGLLASKNFTRVYSAIYLFTAMYAVKNVGARIVLMFIYTSLIFKLVKADLNSRK